MTKKKKWNIINVGFLAQGVVAPFLRVANSSMYGKLAKAIPYISKLWVHLYTDT